MWVLVENDSDMWTTVSAIIVPMPKVMLPYLSGRTNCTQFLSHKQYCQLTNYLKSIYKVGLKEKVFKLLQIH
jgi:hypothetical protein